MGLFDLLGPLLLACVLGAFTALGIGLADETRLSSNIGRLLYTTLSGAVVGTVGTFSLVAPIFGARIIFLRLVIFSLGVALVGLWLRAGFLQVFVLSATGLVTGYLTSLNAISHWIDPASPAPLAMAVTFGLMGLSVGMSRWMANPSWEGVAS